MTARLVIFENSYVLQQATETGWNDLAVLPGGATALLTATRPLSEGGLELAIELAENWLMPHARHLRGDVLEVIDTAGRLRSGLKDVLSAQSTSLGVADIEQLFLSLVDLATGRVPHPALQDRHAFAADLLILRELAHHAEIGEVRLF